MARIATGRRSAPARHSRNGSGTDRPRLYPTKNDLPEETRVEAIELLNQRLADCIDLQTQCKQAHWNVKGPAVHRAAQAVRRDQRGGRGVRRSHRRAHRAARRDRRGNRRERWRSAPSLIDYPLTLTNGAEHVAALSDALAAFGRTARIGIEEMNELEDADSADILTEISRGVDKWLWFVEAHQQDTPE